jgi:hypothetical protein
MRWDDHVLLPPGPLFLPSSFSASELGGYEKHFNYGWQMQYKTTHFLRCAPSSVPVLFCASILHAKASATLTMADADSLGGIMAKHLQIVVNEAFWYQGDRNGRLCSYRQVGNTPKYQITLIRDGGVVLDIFPDDHPKHKFFDPTEGTDPIIQAMRYAEGYDAEHYPP